MNRFASIRFDRALDDSDRSLVTHALGSRGAHPTSWAIAGGRTYASICDAADFDDASAAQLDARLDAPALVVLRIRPIVSERLTALSRVLCGPARPKTIIDATITADEVVVELEPCGRAIVFLLAIVDETLVATPGRTITPVLPLDDVVLAQYASLRLRESELDASRVLDTYVEALVREPVAPA